MFKDNAKRVYYFVKEHESENITANDIADALDLNVKQINGIVTRAFQCKEPSLMKRVPASVECEDGTIKTVKYIHLTDAGMTVDVEAVDEPVKD